MSDGDNDTEEYWRGLGPVDNADVVIRGAEGRVAPSVGGTTWDKSSTGGVRSSPRPLCRPSPRGNGSSGSSAPLLSQFFLLVSSSD